MSITTDLMKEGFSVMPKITQAINGKDIFQICCVSKDGNVANLSSSENVSFNVALEYYKEFVLLYKNTLSDYGENCNHEELLDMLDDILSVPSIEEGIKNENDSEFEEEFIECVYITFSSEKLGELVRWTNKKVIN